MKVSIDWLKKLVDLNISVKDLVTILPLRSIGTKEVTEDFIELDMKGYNRADLLSMRGVAYEVVAVTNSKTLFEEPQAANFAWNRTDTPRLQASILEPKLCPIYCLAKIEGLQVEFSTPEQVRKLEDSGMRSVNNIADITNLIMLEYGQPLHAFAAEHVDGNIQVRKAKEKEELKTLDNKTRRLTPNNLVIADSKKALGLAGVMGGLNSEVTNKTNTILLEAAIFDPVNIRKTTTSQGLPSEASKRFQHGLTKTRLLQALDAAIKQYENLGGKLTGFIIIGDLKDKSSQITLTQEKINSLVGINIASSQVEEYLQKLNFKIKKSGSNWEVKPPYWRLDVTLEEDVIEEVARMYGYDKIPSHKLQGKAPLQKVDPIFALIYKTKQELVKAGLTEVQTYSFFSSKIIKIIGTDSLVKIANPISSETQYMRNMIWPNLIEAIDQNIRQGFTDIAIFEIGKVYSQNSKTPTEEYHLAVALMNGTDNPIEELIAMTKSVIPATEPESMTREFFHPSRHIGAMAEVHPRLLNKLGIQKRIAILEIPLPKL